MPFIQRTRLYKGIINKNVETLSPLRSMELTPISITTIISGETAVEASFTDEVHAEMMEITAVSSNTAEITIRNSRKYSDAE